MCLQQRAEGHVYQGRFRVSPVQDDGFPRSSCRYVETQCISEPVGRACSRIWRWGFSVPLGLAERTLPGDCRRGRYARSAQLDSPRPTRRIDEPEFDGARWSIRPVASPFRSKANWVDSIARRLEFEIDATSSAGPRKRSHFKPTSETKSPSLFLAWQFNCDSLQSESKKQLT